MKIIETCPKCGHDISDIVLTCYPPKRGKMCTNCGWTYTFDDDDQVIRMPFVPPVKKKDNVTIPDYDDTSKHLNWTITSKDYENDPCRNCPNDPRNGGSGICCCTVPYMNPNSKFNQFITFPVQEQDVYFLQGIVSRKKQLIPLITEQVVNYLK